VHLGVPTIVCSNKSSDDDKQFNRGLLFVVVFW